MANNAWRPIEHAPMRTWVLAYARDCGVKLAYFGNQAWEFCPYTHFMPLPDPPVDVRLEVMAELERAAESLERGKPQPGGEA